MEVSVALSAMSYLDTLSSSHKFSALNIRDRVLEARKLWIVTF